MKSPPVQFRDADAHEYVNIFAAGGEDPTSAALAEYLAL
jgi:hypothetical protein